MTRPRIIHLVILVSLAASAVAHAEHFPTKIYTTADGLANNLVNRIVGDSHGYLWFCTREGLSRFDGYDFVTYGIDDGLPGAVINDLLETKEGLYWIATNRGLVRFGPLATREATKTGRPMFSTFFPEADPRTHDVLTLLQDRAGTVWVGTAMGLYKVNDASLVSITFTRMNVESPVNSLTEDTAGVLWIGTGAGIFRRFADGRLKQFTQHDGLPANDVHDIFIDRRGRVWVGTGTSGLAVLAVERISDRLTIAATYSIRDGLPTNWIDELFEARDGSLWAATGNGLVEIVMAGEGQRYRFRSLNSTLGIASASVQAIAEDRIGHLWAGTAEGAAKIATTNFTAYGAADGIRATGTLFESPGDGVIAMEMTGDWRFFRCADRRTIVANLPSSARGMWGWNQVALVDHEGDWWIGTRNGVLRYHGVSRLEELARARPVAHYTRPRDGLAGDLVMRLFEDSRGDVWIGTIEGPSGTGLSRWERKTGTFHHYSERNGIPSLSPFYVSAFGEDQRGNVWIGFSGDAGLVRYRNERFERFSSKDGIPPGAIRNLIRDASGRMWGASFRGGLIRIEHPSDERPVFSRYTTAEGLSSNEVTAVVEDAAGRIYAATGRGLDRLDPATGRIKTYRKGESLPVGEIPAAIRDRAGVLWFSYIAGVIRIVPDGESSSISPVVVINSTGIAGDPQRIWAPAIGQSELRYAELPWNRNAIEVHYVAPGFGPDEGIRYQIKLEGGGSDWSSPSDQRRVVYANLAPGRYRFNVRAVDTAGVVTGAPAGFSFRILPPIWQRWWFRTVVVLLISGLAYGFYRYRVSRLLEVVAIRTRIATDLHDDIGANLTRIAVLSEVVRRKGAVAADDHLASIATVARESVTAMSDIVWAISPGRDGLNDLTSRMREHAEEVFASNGKELTFTAPTIDRDLRLSVDTRRDVYLIFKEAVNNTARHSGCSRVHVRLESNGTGLALSVADDGAGFDVESEDQGNGLASMRSRAARLGAKFDISSQPGGGTTVRLEVPQDRGH